MQISFTPSRELYPFESRWFESYAGRVHFIDEGSGPAILFCHGNPTWSFLYRNIIIALRGRFRCVALDYPGYGLSDRPEGYGYTPGEQARVVAELIAHLDLRDFILFGQDWGGPIGLGAVLADPSRVRGLAIGSTWFWADLSVKNWIFSSVLSLGYFQRRIIQENYFVEKFIPGGTTRKLTALEMDHYRKVQPTPEARRGTAELPRQIRLAHEWLKGVEHGVRTELAGKPLLITWGAKDIAFSASQAGRWQGVFRDNRLLILPEANHYFQEDAPGEVARAIGERFG